MAPAGPVMRSVFAPAASGASLTLAFAAAKTTPIRSVRKIFAGSVYATVTVLRTLPAPVISSKSPARNRPASATLRLRSSTTVSAASGASITRRVAALTVVTAVATTRI
ncbi:MAG: hypothetical protein WDO56_07895 [Gammaproteobacteria bacterium]